MSWRKFLPSMVLPSLVINDYSIPEGQKVSSDASEAFVMAEGKDASLFASRSVIMLSRPRLFGPTRRLALVCILLVDCFLQCALSLSELPGSLCSPITKSRIFYYRNCLSLSSVCWINFTWFPVGYTSRPTLP